MVVVVDERKELMQSGQAAIIFATEAFEGHARGTAGDGKRFKDWLEFELEFKSKFCPQTVEYNVLHTLQHIKVQGGTFLGQQVAEELAEGEARYD